MFRYQLQIYREGACCSCVKTFAVSMTKHLFGPLAQLVRAADS